jgi:mRNA interferase YafQ
MRTIRPSNRFERDFKRESRGRDGGTLDSDLAIALRLLSTDQALPNKFRDHALTGNRKHFRDCHIKPDLILIYRLPDAETLELVRLGSHSELGL